MDSIEKNKEISKSYDPKSIEAFWADFWIDQKFAAPKVADGETKKSAPFVIVIPPPNVTGSLHMGHALNNTLQDILIRWKKMSGTETLWVPGTDHGGIATQNVVEKILKAEKVSRHTLGREKFLERLWQWRQESGDTILMQLRKLGCLLDWDRTRFTMDEVASKAVHTAFSELYKKGWIYRGKRMVNWCTRCATALSDTEVEHEERKDKMYHIRYPILSGQRDGWQGVPLVVATTRPETLLGDSAVAVHPDDPRYEKIHGWWLELPLTGRNIEIVTDDAIDPKFGTGVVKVTPSHDPTDFEIGERHRLEKITVIGYDGKMTKEAGAYAGLSVQECRKKVLEDLEKINAIEKIEEYPHSVGICYRCSSIIEPLISDQWFLKTTEMAERAAQASRNGDVKIFPSNWEKPYLLWLDHLKDWCISRQIWWGHRIPIWWCLGQNTRRTILEKNPEQANLHPSFFSVCAPVSSSEKIEKCPHCSSENMEQDPDVLDTWFSSGLWPFSVLKWPDQNADLQKFYPTSVLVTGHEILYLWVARMVMFGLHFLDKVPFSQVFIHGIVRDKQGKKMSKSMGNVVDPLTMMEQYGTDALRFVLASQSVPGRDMQISNDTFVGARNFANKIWNVSRFALTNIEQQNQMGSFDKSIHPGNLELCDRWILSRYHQTVQTVNAAIADYNMAQAARSIYQFLWSEFCDWYIELSKIWMLDAMNSVIQGNPARKKIVLAVVHHILDGTLRLIHPIMPFITEAIAKNFREILGETKTQTLLQTEYPQTELVYINLVAEQEMQKIMELIGAVRSLRSEMNVLPGTKITLLLKAANTENETFFKAYSKYIQHLCKAETVTIGTDLAKPAKAASAVLPWAEAFVPLEGLIDFEKEKTRLSKDLETVSAELTRVTEKLAYPQFLTHAPQEEVEKTKRHHEETKLKQKRLTEHLASLK